MCWRITVSRDFRSTFSGGPPVWEYPKKHFYDDEKVFNRMLKSHKTSARKYGNGIKIESHSFDGKQWVLIEEWIF